MIQLLNFWVAIVIVAFFSLALTTGGTIWNVLQDGVRQTWKLLVTEKLVLVIWVLSVAVILIWVFTLLR